MKIQTVASPEHFFTYCALLFNDNHSINYSKNTENLKAEVCKTLEKSNFPHIQMPDHRYQYLLSILNSDGYVPNNNTNKDHDEILNYVKTISEISDMKALWLKKQQEVKEELKLYEKPINKLTKFFKDYFDFEPKVNTFSITRNWDRSGMCIPTKDAHYILVGWNSNVPNLRNAVHEIMHMYVEEVDLNISIELQKMIDQLPDEVFNKYRKSYVIAYESLVRALVVYLTSMSEAIEKQEFSKEDLLLQLPEKYLAKLISDSPKCISKDYLSNLSL